MSPTLWLLAGALVPVTLLWLVSLRLGDVSIIDIWWGPGIALIADLACFWVPALGFPGKIALCLVNVWALRLGTHIFARHKGEDHRYAAMRQQFARRWWWWSLVQVFFLQGILIWLVAAPLIAAVLAGPRRVTGLELAGVILAAAGLILEGIADRQLTRFRADPANRIAVLDTGLWAWSRHPNYFGDCVMWWGFFLIGFGASHAWWLVASPFAMSVLLLKVSGVTLMEETIGRRRPGYQAYVRCTSAFVPWPPRK